MLACTDKLYCCSSMEYFMSSYKNLADSLEIKPRVILFSKKLRVRHTYEKTIEITNKAMYPRYLNYTTNCKDITLGAFPRHMWNTFLGCEETVVLEVKLQPTEQKSINKCRYIYVDASHPKVRFEIPILILCKNDNSTELPEKVTFLPICPKNSTFYEMVIYNKTKQKLSKIIKPNIKHLKVLRSTKDKIPPNKFTKVLFELIIHKKKSVDGLLKIKLGQDIFTIIPFAHKTIQMSVHVGTNVLKFNSLKFRQEEKKTVNICNETNLILKPKVRVVEIENIKNLFNIETEKNLDALAYKHFNCNMNSDYLPSNTLTKCNVIFRPVQHKDFSISDAEIPPFSVISVLKISVSIDTDIHEYTENDTPPPLDAFVKLIGSLKGLELDVIPKNIDITTVYFGEEHCMQVKVINIDGLNSLHVKPLKYEQVEVANVIVTPTEGVTLSPCQSFKFTVQFYVTIVGRFIIKLEFKVTHGDIFCTHIRGNAQKAHCRVFPDMLCLGEIPIAIPQKRNITLINPLSVPITLQCSLEEEEGSETPLVLNVLDVNENLPINVLDPVKHIQRCRAEEQEENNIEQMICKVVEGEQDITSIYTEHSVNDDDATSYSTNFGEIMLDSIPLMARNFITQIKKGKYVQKNDCELLILDKALNCLLQHNYFHGMDKNKNYMNMDWNALSIDPREVFVSNELIYLTPNSNKVLSIVIIPNRIGSQQRFIKIRVCPQILPECDDHETENMRRIIDTQYMTTKLTVEFTCAVPNIMWVKKVKMEGKVYPGKWYKFEMVFENPGTIAGFFFYDMVPKSPEGEMKFLNDKWKYFIEPNSKIAVPCAVEFKTIGSIVLPGLLKFLGMPVGLPFFIEAFVLPTAVRYEPQSILRRIEVLTYHRIYVYIHNVTPTPTWFRLEVKNEFIDAYPLGAQLHPKGQSTYITLSMFFYDPGIYHTSLDIHMQHSNKMKIPINITVRKMPIIFEPEVRIEDIHFQNVLCVTEKEFDSGEICLRKRIKVINRGKKPYRIIIKTKKLSENTTCAVNPRVRGYITIEPLVLIIQPESEQYIDVLMSACEECSIYHEYWIQIYDLVDPKRVESSRFALKATFVYPKVMWSKNLVQVNYYRTHKYKDHLQWELVYLTNMADNILNLVQLKVACPFHIKLLFEDELKKELTFPMKNYERKSIFIVLDKKTVRDRNLTDIDGYIMCTANKRLQKSLRLKLKVFAPELLLLNNNITLFAREQEAMTYIKLLNNKSVKATYKWKKLHEEWHYISEKENVEQAVHILLSDILDAICFEDVPKPQSKTNMSQYYQTYRCCLKKNYNIDDNDTINVKGILYDIINELDIERKRYRLDYKSPQSSNEIFNPNKVIIDGDEDANEKRQRGGGGGSGDEILQSCISYNSVYQLVSTAKVEIPKQIHGIYDSDDEGSVDKIFNLFMNSKEVPHILKQQQQTGSEIENLLDSDSSDEGNSNFQKTLYFNQQFRFDQSSTDVTYHGTSKDSCVYYTVDHILDHLKLDDSYTLSLPSTDTCETLRSIYFLKKSGVVDENQTELCILHLPPVKTGYEVKASFLLDVVGGQSVYFSITLVNVENTLKISKYNIFVGMKPWYEKFKSQVTIENVTNYTLKLKLCQILPPQFSELPKVAAGYVRLLNDHEFDLPSNEMTTLKINGILGFNEEFLRILNIKINDGEEKILHIKGTGVIPMILPLKYDLQLIEQDLESVYEDYRLLQRIYYFAIFSNITEQHNDDENALLEDEEGDVQKGQQQKTKENDDEVTDSISSTEISNSSKQRKREERFFALMKTYVLVNNNEELPNAKVLHQLLQTEKFLKKMRCNRRICHQVQTIYNNYEQTRKMCAKNPVINLKSFFIQPLPIELPGVILNLGELLLNEFHKFQVNLEFHGPGKLIASLRSAIKIPCFVADFEISENTGNKDFTYYQPEDNQLCLPKMYRNLYERIVDGQSSSKVKYPHDYDVDLCKHIHQRISNIYERKCIYNYYNSLNKSIYAEQKHHVIHCKMLTNYKCNFSNAKFNLVILFKPEFQYYKHGQEIEDYLYVDLHMGPTLPILLRGTVLDRKRKDIAQSDTSLPSK